MPSRPCTHHHSPPPSVCMVCVVCVVCVSGVWVGRVYRVHMNGKEKKIDEDGIRTHACRAQWISNPSP